jgi:hypothetical protein
MFRSLRIAFFVFVAAILPWSAGAPLRHYATAPIPLPIRRRHALATAVAAR